MKNVNVYNKELSKKEIESAKKNIGKFIVFNPWKNRNDEVTGIIKTVTCDSRNGNVFYRILDENDKMFHKLVRNKSEYQILKPKKDSELGEKSKKELLDIAKELGITGRHDMNKDKLIEKINDKR